MNFQTKDSSMLRVLCISCMPDGEPKLTPQATDRVRYDFVQSTEDACRSLFSETVHCLMVLFDPSSQSSALQLETLCACAQEYDVPVVSLSTFNPIWIQYLMRHFDVAKHFRALPTDGELIRLVAAFTSSKTQKPVSKELQVGRTKRCH